MYFPGSGNVEHGSFFEKKNKNKQINKKKNPTILSKFYNVSL